ncbi:hypothetical protein [Maricaulis sp.]|uniref:hypothetical protein n=1 Tax=Maricaulis sp. TaxID=1486257 RepID=UPI002633A176|nr:hypothetical protein [Maricaulis sp.]
MHQLISIMAASALLSGCFDGEFDNAVSTYSNIEPEVCEGIYSSDEGPVFVSACQGVGPWTVYVHADSHREMTAYATVPLEPGERPEHFAFGGYMGNMGGYNNVIEWRLKREGGEPFATIHRYRFPDPDDFSRAREILTVTALRADYAFESCHVGYVDATDLPDANVLARELADRLSYTFRCGTDYIWVIDRDTPTIEAAIAARQED